MSDAKKFITKDSGERQEFGTGSKRDTREGKGRFDLIPTAPLRRLAGLYERGAAKYGDRNWEKGQPLSRYIDSALRHLNCLLAGEPEEDHAAAVAWNMFGLMYTTEMIAAGRLPAELSDLPPPEPQYAPKTEKTPYKRYYPDGFCVEEWLRGGCAWCGEPSRDGNLFIHDECVSQLAQVDGQFTKCIEACNAHKAASK